MKAAGDWERRTRKGEIVVDFAMAFNLGICYTPVLSSRY